LKELADDGMLPLPVARLLAPLTLGGVGAWVGAPWDRHLGSVRIGRDVRFPKLSSILGG